MTYNFRLQDGYVSVKEVARLVEAVGGSMTETEAAAVIKTVGSVALTRVLTVNNTMQASKEKRAWVDFEDFRAIWSAIQGMEEVRVLVERFSTLLEDLWKSMKFFSCL